MVGDAMIRAAAVGGVAIMWSYFTLKTARIWVYLTHEALRISGQIVFPPEKPRKYRCVYCSFSFTSDFVPDRRGVNYYFYVCKHCEGKDHVCENCQKCLIVDEELELRHSDENKKAFCENCFKKQFEKIVS